MNSNSDILDSDPLVDDRIERWRSKSWVKLYAVHFLLFGTGLFYIDQKIERNWIYVICALYAWLSLINVFMRVIPELERFHNHNLFGAMTIIAGWVIAYGIGGIDATIALSRRKKGLG